MLGYRELPARLSLLSIIVRRFRRLAGKMHLDGYG
jgi:hypothetical protein